MECDADGAVRPFVFQQDCDNPSHLVARRGLKLVSDVLRVSRASVRRTQRQLGCIHILRRAAKRPFWVCMLETATNINSMRRC